MPTINVFDALVASETNYGFGGYNEEGGDVINVGFPAILINAFDIVRLLQVEPLTINTSDNLVLSENATVLGPFFWSSLGSLGSAASKTANQNSLNLVTTSVLPVGRVAVVLIAVDNNQTTDGDEGAVTSVTDSVGNTYIKAREFTNGQGAAQAGATISIWYCKATSQLNSGQQITANFNNATSRDASAITAWKFDTAAAGTISVAGTATLANDTADPGSMDLSLPGGEYLWIRGTAHERPSTDTFTKTVAYAGTFDKNGTTGGGANTNITVAGEWAITTTVAPLFFDPFSQSNESPLSSGGVWSDSYAGHDPLQVVGNRVRNSVLGNDSRMTVNSVSPPANQYAQIKLATFNPIDGLAAILLLRWSAPTTPQGYEIAVIRSGGAD